MKLPGCVILCFCFFIPSLFAISWSYKRPDSFCLFILGPEVSDDLAVAVETAFQKRLRIKCLRLSVRMDDPFSSSSQILWKNYSDSFVFGFWLGVDTMKKNYLLRGLDMKDLLEFGVRRSSGHSLGSGGMASMADQLVKAVIDQYPYSGFVEGDRFFAWSSDDSLWVDAVKRGVAQRHPFRPALMDFSTLSPAGTAGKLIRSRDGKHTLSIFANLPTLPKEKIWLRPSNRLDP